MHVDPATIAPVKETPRGTAGETRSEKTPVDDVFAAVLSAVAPTTATTGPLSSRSPSGAAAATGDGSQGHGPSGTASAAALIAATTGALRAVAGQSARPGLIEVPRDEQGLPLVPGKIGEQPAPGTGSDDPEAGTLDGRPAAPSAPAGLAVEAASTKPETATTPPAGQDGPSEPPAGTASSADARHSAAAAGPRPVMAQPDVAAMLPPGVGTTVTAGSVAVSMPAASAPDALGRGTTPPVDPQQIQAQVARQILAREQAAGDGPGTLTLRLEPEHLGKVEVRLRASGGQLTVEFQAESAEAGAALREGRHELARALGAQAGRWQQVEVRVADPERPGAETEEHEEERSEHGSGRERDPDERRRERGER